MASDRQILRMISMASWAFRFLTKKIQFIKSAQNEIHSFLRIFILWTKFMLFFSFIPRVCFVLHTNEINNEKPKTQHRPKKYIYK